MSDLFELPELFVDILLDLGSLGEEHVPLPDVVYCFVVVGHKVPLYQWAVAHEQSLSSALGVFAYLVVGQRGALALLTVATFLLVGAVLPLPVGQRRGVNLGSREKLAERVHKLTHERLSQRLSALGVSKVQTVEYSL